MFAIISYLHHSLGCKYLASVEVTDSDKTL
jgi:hypothetical protein